MTLELLEEARKPRRMLFKDVSGPDLYGTSSDPYQFSKSSLQASSGPSEELA